MRKLSSKGPFGTRQGSCADSRPLLSVPGMDPEKLERIQLPVPTAAEKTTYNHLLAERLIRIMNNAAQPGARECRRCPGVGELQGPGPTPAPGASASGSGHAGNPGGAQPLPGRTHTLGHPDPPIQPCLHPGVSSSSCPPWCLCQTLAIFSSHTHSCFGQLCQCLQPSSQGGRGHIWQELGWEGE